MSEQRPDTENDPRVTRAYREAATETTPAAIDEAVLQQARQALSGNGWQRYAKSIHWLRPMAWAATIGLSLAIVLELTMSPPIETELMLQQELPAAAPADMPLAPRRDADDRELPSAATVDDERALAPRQQADELPKSKAADAPALASDAEVKQELERLIRYREEAESRSADRAFAAEDVAASEPSAAYAIAVPCSEDETALPESWLACIERLDEQGRHGDARRERERLAKAFPDFELRAPAN